jgi:response regulator of citrate/malate metabolism
VQTRLLLAIIEDQTSIREMLHQYLCAQSEFECVLTDVSMEALHQQLPILSTPPLLTNM